MSTNPHEAPYDVLKLKKERFEEQQRVLRHEQTIEEEYAEWTENNNRIRNR